MRICHTNIELSERDLNIILEDFKGQKKEKIKFLNYMYIRLTADLALIKQFAGKELLKRNLLKLKMLCYLCFIKF